MELISIAIITNDLEYGTALARRMTDFQRNFLITIADGDEIHNKEYLEKYDILLFDCEELSEVTNERSLFLSECKYGNVKELCGKVLFLFAQNCGKRYLSPAERRGSIICFASAEGGSGTTSVALATAQEIVRFHGKRVLYLSFDEFEDTLHFFPEAEKKTIGQFLYYLRKGDSRIFALDRFLLSDDYGVIAFFPEKGKNCLLELDDNDLCLFFQSLMKTGRFDYFLVDLGKTLHSQSLWLYENCSRFVSVSTPASLPAKKERIDAYLSSSVSKDICQKGIRVLNKYDYTEEEFFEGCIKIDYDTASIHRLNERVQIRIDGSLGMGIRELANELT